MNFDDDEEWDVDFIENLVRKEEEVIAAKRATQQQITIPPASSAPSFIRPYTHYITAHKHDGGSLSKKKKPSSSSASDYFDFVSNWQKHSASIDAAPASLSVQAPPHGRKLQDVALDQVQAPRVAGGSINSEVSNVVLSARGGDVALKPQTYLRGRSASVSCQSANVASTEGASPNALDKIGGQPDYSKYSHIFQQGNPETPDERDKLIRELQGRLLQADEELNDLRRKALYSNGALSSIDQKEIERLQSQILFKDQEIFEARRVCTEKANQLKVVSNEVERLHREANDKLRQFEPLVKAKRKQEEKQQQESEAYLPPGGNQSPWHPPWTHERALDFKKTVSTVKDASASRPPSGVSNEESLVVAELKARTLDNGCIPCMAIERDNQTPLQEIRAKDTTKASPIENKSGQRTLSCSHKLLELWGSGNWRRDSLRLTVKLLTLCQADIHMLLSVEVADGKKVDTAVPSSGTGHAVNAGVADIGGLEARGLHSVLSKMVNGLTSSWAFFMAVLEMCDLENVLVVESALRVIRCILINDSSCRNVLFGRSSFPECIPGAEDSWNGSKGADTIASHVELLKLYSPSPRLYFKMGETSLCPLKDLSPETWKDSTEGAFFRRFFTKILSMARTHLGQGVLIEVVSILNVLVNNSEPLSEREYFGSVLFDGSISSLLKETNGLDVQLQAVRLVHNVLHCPCVLKLLCTPDVVDHFSDPSGKQMRENQDEQQQLAVKTAGALLSSSKRVEVLKDLIMCLLYVNGSFQEYRLRRNSLRVLTFVATSGAEEFTTLLALGVSLGKGNTKEEKGEASKGQEVFSLAVHLVTLLDHELKMEEQEDSKAIREERECLTREALILLCRLAAKSSTTLTALASDKAMAMLSVCVTSRLISRGALYEDSKPDGKCVISSTDMVEFARGLKRRLLASIPC